MGKIIQFPSIAGVEITTDAEGRFNLNALHRASGGEKKNGPTYWLALDSTLKLIDEMKGKNTEIPVFTAKGRNGGTFAAEQLAVAYANWISPAFYLQVIDTFLAYKKGTLQPAVPQTLPEALRLAAEAMEARDKLIPKAEAYDRIATTDGGMCITNAAKDLQMRPKDLFAWLQVNRWIYRRPGGGNWIAYQEKLQTGYLEHKVTTVSRSDGSEKTVEQVLVTPKGLAKLAKKVMPIVA